LGFVWLQKSVNLEDTMDGKTSFERYCQEHGVYVKHYHADNGIFVSNAWRQSCLLQGQDLSFAGVAAHHQNGIAERRIRELQEMMHTMLTHAQHRWTNAISANLWPYALRMANDAFNATPNFKFKDARTPIESFTGTKIASNPIQWHSFGCPAYVLVQGLQTDTAIHHKWKTWSRVGVYLGRSPQHARDVSLVLNLNTGLASLQFHVKLDSNFQTLREPGIKMPQSWWQIKCGFVQQPTKASPPDPVPATEETRGPPPMPDSEGSQSTTVNDLPIVPGTDAEEGPEPEPEQPPLRQSKHLCRPVDQSWLIPARTMRESCSA